LEEKKYTEHGYRQQKNLFNTSQFHKLHIQPLLSVSTRLQPEALLYYTAAVSPVVRRSDMLHLSDQYVDIVSLTKVIYVQKHRLCDTTGGSEINIIDRPTMTIHWAIILILRIVSSEISQPCSYLTLSTSKCYRWCAEWRVVLSRHFVHFSH